MTERPRNRIVTEHERSTTEVLVAYRMSAFGYNDMPDDAPHDPEELAEVDAEFHNWLEQVRAEARADALADAGLPARPIPTRDEIAEAIYDVLGSQYGDFCVPTDAADAVLALLKGQDA